MMGCSAAVCALAPLCEILGRERLRLVSGSGGFGSVQAWRDACMMCIFEQAGSRSVFLYCASRI